MGTQLARKSRCPISYNIQILGIAEKNQLFNRHREISEIFSEHIKKPLKFSSLMAASIPSRSQTRPGTRGV